MTGKMLLRVAVLVCLYSCVTSYGSTKNGTLTSTHRPPDSWNRYLHHLFSHRPPRWGRTTTVSSTSTSHWWSWPTGSNNYWWGWSTYSTHTWSSSSWWGSSGSTPSWWNSWGSSGSTPSWWNSWGSSGSTPSWWLWWCGVTPSWTGTPPTDWNGFWSASTPGLFHHSKTYPWWKTRRSPSTESPRTTPYASANLAWGRHSHEAYYSGWKWTLIWIGVSVGILTLIVGGVVALCLKCSALKKSRAKISVYTSQPTYLDMEKNVSNPAYDSYGPPALDPYAPPTYSTVNLKKETFPPSAPPAVVTANDVKTV
ncbi:hypothetical protein EB796_008196 [Bugula neritina]|uniref:Uncharacterized protein n=1 Tax=Bugula neritina TaxID=10212 RepID=A0A7J7K5H8_BUGNE|nr:hypothetical protein EB796_008196 [Bugula neritina]